MKKECQPEGNYYNKYETQNSLEKIIIRRFFNSLMALLGKIEFHNLHEAGCGEGYIAKYIAGAYPGVDITASDLSENIIRRAENKMSKISFSTESIYSLSYSDNYFDLVIASEVLEHLEEPEKALTEILRVSNKYILLSVPREPIWRICNMARGKYLGRCGNTPGHVQHWSNRSFMNFIGKQCQIIEARYPFPWSMVLCKKLKNK